MVYTGKFLLQLLQMKVAPILLDAIILGKYTECTIVCSGVLVDFMFGIDLAEMNISWVIFAPIVPNESCSQSLEISWLISNQNTEMCFEICCKLSLEICSLHTPNGRRLSFENWLKSVISLISLKSVHFVHLSLNGRRLSFENCLEALKSVISLKSGDLIKIDNFPCNDTER